MEEDTPKLLVPSCFQTGRTERSFMPTLQFKGRNVIWNHHLSVPYHTLDEVPELDVNPANSGKHLLIEGDNLTALKALLPRYSGRIDCIYIDPPYNTGNDTGENKAWIYSDKVNSPLIREWFQKEVGVEDLTRHDKWLCMLTPRLQLLRELLSDIGIIFISIDHNEYHHLECLCNEIFGEENYVGRFIWKRKKQPSFLQKHIANVTEYVLVFAKNSAKVGKLSIEKVTDDTRRIDNASNEISERVIRKGTRVKKDTRLIKKGTYQIRTMILEFLDDVKVFNGRTTNEFRVKGQFRNKQEDIDRFCKDDLLFITENGGFRRLPAPEEIEKQKTVVDLLLDWGDNQDSDKEIIELLGEKKFEYPKPVKLVKNLIASTQYEQAIILDSFAGSGTTGQAVMELNKEGANHKFILVQMTEAQSDSPSKNICKDITRERLRRVIEKYGYDAGFKYLRVGSAIDAETLLSGNLPTYEQFAKYVFYLCTGENLQDERNINEAGYFVGHHGKSSVYLIYRQDFEQLTRLALNMELAQAFRHANPQKRIVVYAPACFLGEEDLEELQIDFVSIPYNLFEHKG